MMKTSFSFLRGLALLALLAGCTPRSQTTVAPPTSLGSSLEPASVREPITVLEKVEDLSETVANRLIDFSDSVRKRDYQQASSFLSDDFQGTAFPPPDSVTPGPLALGVEQGTVEVALPEGEGVDGSAFLESLAAHLSGLESIEYVFFKTRGAEFEATGERGVLRMTVQIIGRAPGQAPHALYGWARAEVLRNGESWSLRRFLLNRFQVTRRERPLFTDVAGPAGLAVRGGRLGGDGNRSFYWRGAATGDFDGDGLFDIYTSGPLHTYLYRNRGDGTFENVIEKAGIDAPAGSTGALFLDLDRDGDQDLFLAYVGWLQDAVPAGRSSRLYRNEGDGTFTDISVESGVAGLNVCAFSVSAADVDDDGWLDIYLSCYNRLDTIAPDSWYRATNGTRNVLLMNEEGKRLVDRAEKAGVADPGWSYAAAFADYDEDGDQDLYVANDYGDNALYRNRGDGTFENVAREMGVLDTGNGMGATWGDLDNDGRLDLYVSNMSSSAGNRILKRLAAQRAEVEKEQPAELTEVVDTLFKLAAGNTIFRRNGKVFEQLPVEYGGVGASWAWSASLMDFDLDGIQDIYVANGFISGESLKDT